MQCDTVFENHDFGECVWVSENIALIGYGNMGRALASGWVASGRDAGTITVVESHEPAASAARSAGFPILARPGEADVIVLAIKPKQLPGAVAALGPIPAGTVLLSIAAGCTLGSIEVAAGGDVAVVRAMPNTPAAIGRGMTGLCANSSVTEDQRALCGQLMEAVGQVVWVEDETMMDAVTAVSGSGPAYVFLLIEALAEAGRQVGLSPAVADQLATQLPAPAPMPPRPARRQTNCGVR